MPDEASSVSARITAATGSVATRASVNGSAVRSGSTGFGNPRGTAASSATPRSASGANAPSSPPSTIITSTHGTFGHLRGASSRITSVAKPSAAVGRLMVFAASKICPSSSNSSPVPVPEPSSFGTCMRMISQQTPLMNPPMTGSEM